MMNNSKKMTVDKNEGPPIKISEAILRIAEPLIRKYPKRERTIVIIDLAIFSWNASLESETRREEIEKKLIDRMPARLDATDIATIIEQTDILIGRKKKLYPDIKYFIVKHDLKIEDNGRITLDLGAIKQPE